MKNPGGYNANALVRLSQHLRGKFPLVYDTDDDRVRFQNPIAFVDAVIQANQLP